MKTHFIFIISFLILCLPLYTTAQNGDISRFTDVKGDHTMVAGHDKIFVINSRTDDDRNCMLVEDIVSGNKKKFYTTPHVEPSSCYTCSGYYVNEMVVDDDYNSYNTKAQ